MAIFETMRKAMQEGDADTYLSLLADDYHFVRHSSGTSLDKAGMGDLVRGMMESGNWKASDLRCVYENDDILVEHSVMDFPDGTREAVMSVNMKRGDKIYRTETGATPVN